MPIHDWTKVGPSTYHHFHSLWIGELSKALNSGLLPPAYYAMAEQHAAGVVADVLTLEHTGTGAGGNRAPPPEDDGGVALLEAPPKVAVTEKASGAWYASQRRTLTVRHTSGDTIVAMIEILSPGNKASQDKLEEFVHKAYQTLSRGIHLLLVDLFPPGSFDPQGIHGELRRELVLEREEGEWPVPGKPLTLAAYEAPEPRAYVEPVAIGDTMIDMPLFLQWRRYINVPLEKTYLAAYGGVPQRWRSVIEG
jgi:hypothetical protein